jgi:hypothetical protein
MVTATHAYLVQQLVALGVPEGRVFTDAASLAGHDPVPKAILLIDDERVRRVGQRVGAAEGVGTRTIRTQLWERRLPVTVTMVLDSQAAADAAVDGLLAGCFVGPAVDGNRWRVECLSIVWEEERSRLVAKRIRVDVELEFVGGVFRERTVPLVTDVLPRPAVAQG